VLICMFDAQEASKGMSSSTVQYYNGELFGNLRRIVSHNQASIERLILVFNKYDLLRRSRSNNVNDKTIMQDCLHAFSPILGLLKGTCNPERVCEVFTILDREEITTNNRGAPIVLGEAARGFVHTMAGNKAAKSVVSEEASTFAADYF